MFNRPSKAIRERLNKLERHLRSENPLLLDAIERFKRLDRVAYRLGLLDRNDSYATRIPWWPLISVLGTFSAGKSSFINQFLGSKLQSTGNQAVDDKFTVVCYSGGEDGRVLPGLALDSDPRFPFYQMSDEIEKVSAGEGKRIDAYLQMKTSVSEKVRGKILIDSPGFDADDQRNATLRLTNHIIDLSDLVLVFFDARHPEPGAMQDTLEHLVAQTIARSDSGKFLYILNQIDSAAQEDNPEDVVAAWQRSISQKGLTAGRFFTIYNEEVAVPIVDSATRERFQNKRDSDLAEIYHRITQVEVERSYRIMGLLESTSSNIEVTAVPALKSAMSRWMRRVLVLDAVVFGLFSAAVIALCTTFDLWDMFSLSERPVLTGIAAAIAGVLVIAIHFANRSFIGKRIAYKLDDCTSLGSLRAAFLKNIRPMRSIFQPSPVGWKRRSKKILASVTADASEFIQRMNDRYTNPSGDK